MVEIAQDNTDMTHGTAAAWQIVMVSEIIMVTFEITGVMYEGLFRSGCLLLHVWVIDSGEGGGPGARG